MPNLEHVALLDLGDSATRAWRESHPRERLDFVGADLRGRRVMGQHLDDGDFRGAQFEGASFEWCSLTNADLSGSTGHFNLINCHAPDSKWVGSDHGQSYMVGTYLYRADFTDANLAGANLCWTNLRRSVFANADLRHALFQNAELPYATLRGATCEGAELLNTVLTGVDFTGATGLDQLEHKAPSTLDQESILRSGELPSAFLHGIGLSDDLIQFYAAQAGAIRHYTGFISYSAQDQSFVSRLYQELLNKGIRCFLAPEDLIIGSKTRPAIHDAIRTYDKLILVLSERSISSGWVEEEVEMALDIERRDGLGLKLLPIRLDDAVFETQTAWVETVRGRHIGDFRLWEIEAEFSLALDRLMLALRSREATANP